MCCTENIIIPYDISGRYVHQLVYFAQGFGSGVYLSAHGRTVNCKSIIGVLSLGLTKGDNIQLSVTNKNGDDATHDIQNLIAYLRNRGEEV